MTLFVGAVALTACGDDDGAGGDASSTTAADAGDAGGSGDTGGGPSGGLGGTGDARLDAGRPRAMAVDGDGIVVAGDLEGDFFLARFDGNGVLDPSFGEGGFVTTDLGGAPDGFVPEDIDVPYVVRVASDGIFVAGHGRSRLGTDGGGFGIVKYTPGGALDPSFGDGGIVFSDWTVRAVVYELLVDDAGRPIAIGTLDNGSGIALDFVAARYMPNGDVDPSFSATGEGPGAVLDFDDAEEGVTAMFTDDGGLLIGGGRDFEVAKLTADGRLDTSFGTGGWFESPGGVLYRMLPKPGGAAQLVGIQKRDGEDTFSQIKIAQMTPAGALDPSFGTGGEVIVDFDFTLLEVPDGEDYMGSFGAVRGVQPLDDGGLAIFSAFLGVLTNVPVVVKLGPDFAPDPGFGDGGIEVLLTHLALLADIGPQISAQRAVLHGGRLWVSDMEVLRDQNRFFLAPVDL